MRIRKVNSNQIILHENTEVKFVGRFIARPVCNYIGKKVSGLKPKVYSKKFFKKLGFDKALKQEEKAVSIETKSESAIAEEVAIKGETVWDNMTGTADKIPSTKIPATFKIDLDGGIKYANPQTGTNTLWTNANVTEHMGEYVVTKVGA